MDNQDEFETLLEYLKRSRGFDFTGYKRASLGRRVRRRMQEVGLDSFEAYLNYLEAQPDEFGHLFDTILINVTDFFRDPEPWQYLADELVPRILQGKRADDPIRVWSAGCASGKEAYSVAILLAEALGEEAFRERVKIYATDVDEAALAIARHGQYSAKEIENLPLDWLERYFEPVNQHHYTFRKDLRRSLIFGRHDLLQDAPISRVDLLLCRNTLMYFNAEAQTRILARLNFALNPGGYLFLGKAEMLLSHANLFVAVNLTQRIFAKVSKPNLRERLLLMAQEGSDEHPHLLSSYSRIREVAFEQGPTAQLVVDAEGFLVLANERARSLFAFTLQSLGRPLRDLEVSYRPVELRSIIEQSRTERGTVKLREVTWRNRQGEMGWYDVEVTPLIDDRDRQFLGASILFVDVTSYKQLQEELSHLNQELETAYEELQATNEELETTNEELQSTIEELETTNEELQSTNEELETMNEELQSTNEEMETINEELHRRSEELNQVNAFLESILTSMRGGVVVLDAEQRVQVWNHKAEDLWGLRADEVEGEHFLNLDIGLPVEQLRQPIRTTLAGGAEEQEVVLAATNRRGKPIRCHVHCTPLRNMTAEVVGVILVMNGSEA